MDSVRAKTHAGGRLLLVSAALASATFCGLGIPAEAAEFYIDPVAGTPDGDGSAGDPWQTLQQVVEDGLIETQIWETLPYEEGVPLVPVNDGAPVQPGDTLWLRTGYHGELELRGAYNAAPIRIAAAPGHAPELGRIELESVQHWLLRGLSISPSHADPALDPGTIVSIEDHSWWGPTWDVEIVDSDIFTVDDSSSWGATEWLDLAATGVNLTGARVSVRNSTVRNVRFGITASGDDTLVSGNVIDGFSADGLRGLGNSSVYEYNRIQNTYVTSGQGDSNHDDGFQSWSVGPGGVGTGEVRDVILRGNLFINYDDPEDDLRATMQGIGCFDGLYVNWRVENNVVITDHWHGISLYGAIDSVVINNSVIDLNEVDPGPPWILVTDSKDGVPSENVVVRNNLAPQITVSGVNVTADHNLEFSEAFSHFVAPPYDLHLLESSEAVHGGSSSLAPVTDIEGRARPQGSAVDIGAYELPWASWQVER